MNTKTHIAVTSASISIKYNESTVWAFNKKMRRWIPILILPDAFRKYLSARQATHCETTPNGGFSYCVLPERELLKLVNKENLDDYVEYYVSPDIPVKENGKYCDIGEYSDLAVFEEKNKRHTDFELLMVHMEQDDVLDHYLREQMIDPERRCEDIYVVRHSGRSVNGADLRIQIAKFEELMFLKAVERVYLANGMILGRRWYDEVVKASLYEVYSEDLAAGTYKYMPISDDMTARIEACDFAIRKEEKDEIFITDDVEKAIADILDEAIARTLAYI